ncbi:hypothetical protein HPP12_0053 [Helicobacter pylori P12]|uniref:Uncharacterized protein n=1 Tax=Helicobacter pylori (strain P12) TaxID=570508 RepID=B6JPF2_HELP2|nr:hypothetical protein HPP12_0053 [Helicobacter pylori P12]
MEVRGCLNFNFVATTHSAMDLNAYVLSDSKYYLESLYNKLICFLNTLRIRNLSV